MSCFPCCDQRDLNALFLSMLINRDNLMYGSHICVFSFHPQWILEIHDMKETCVIKHMGFWSWGKIHTKMHAHITQCEWNEQLFCYLPHWLCCERTVKSIEVLWALRIIENMYTFQYGKKRHVWSYEDSKRGAWSRNTNSWFIVTFYYGIARNYRKRNVVRETREFCFFGAFSPFCKPAAYSHEATPLL